jgi:hypothetical protein
MDASEGGGPTGPEGRAERAQQLDELVFECLERIEVEGPQALEAVCHAHADSAPELLERIRALLLRGLVDIGDDGDRPRFARGDRSGAGGGARGGTRGGVAKASPSPSPSPSSSSSSDLTPGLTPRPTPSPTPSPTPEARLPASAPRAADGGTAL